MDETPKKKVTITVERTKSEAELREERIEKWENDNNLNFDDTISRMIHEFIHTISLYEEHFLEESKRIKNDDYFFGGICWCMRLKLEYFIDYTSGYEKETRKDEYEEWKFTKESIIKTRRIYGSISRKHSKFISEKLREGGHIPPDREMSRIFANAHRIAINATPKYEGRGSNRTPASFLAVNLFEDFEDLLRRKLARSFS